LTLVEKRARVQVLRACSRACEGAARSGDASPLSAPRQERETNRGPPGAPGGAGTQAPKQARCQLGTTGPPGAALQEPKEANLRLRSLVWCLLRDPRHKLTFRLLSCSSPERHQRHARVEDFGLALSMLWVPARRDSLVRDPRAWRGEGCLASLGLAVLLVELAWPVRRGVVPTAGANYYHAFAVRERCDLQRVAARVLYKAGQVASHAWALPASGGDGKPRGSQARRAKPAARLPVPVVAGSPLRGSSLLARWRSCRGRLVGLRAAGRSARSCRNSQSVEDVVQKACPTCSCVGALPLG
jgi:hypothetical protein